MTSRHFFEKLGYSVPMSDARKDITVRRELVDIAKGRQGSSDECMNANCILRTRKEFGHHVYAVEVLKTAAFVVDEMKGSKASHCIRYVLNDKEGQDIDRHDSGIGGFEVRPVTLYAAKGAQKLMARDRDVNNNGAHGKAKPRPRRGSHGNTERSGPARRRKVMKVALGELHTEKASCPA